MGTTQCRNRPPSVFLADSISTVEVEFSKHLLYPTTFSTFTVLRFLTIYAESCVWYGVSWEGLATIIQEASILCSLVHDITFIVIRPC